MTVTVKNKTEKPLVVPPAVRRRAGLAIPVQLRSPPDIAAKCDGPNQFEKVDRLFRSVISVPKATIDEAEQKWKQERARKRAKKTA